MPSKGERGNRRKRTPYDFEAFRGYSGPRFTPIPDEFLDHQLADLSSAEAKVMLFLFRKTYGYRKSADRVSLAQLQHGTMSSSGAIIDRGTGLSRATIWRALKGLQEKGLIDVHRQTTPAGDMDINYYRIREDSATRHPVEDDEAPRQAGSAPGRSRTSRNEGGGEGPDSRSTALGTGWFNAETTPVSELNHRGFRTRPGGSLVSEPTRENSTRQDSTLSPDLPELAQQFLTAIGYSRPTAVKRERTLRILESLHHDGGYTLDELQAASEIAASMGARGPELIPHVIGKAPPHHVETEIGERVSRQETEERTRWQSLVAEFEALPSAQQKELLDLARQSNEILAKRPIDHPLVRAAAIALLDGT
jgi:biotin operon repressor